MNNDTQVRQFLERMAGEVEVSSLDGRGPAKRARRRRTVTVAAVVAGAAAVALAASIGLGSLTRTAPEPARTPTPTVSPSTVPPASRPVFQRTATIGGLTITSSSSWFLVDYWGAWNPDATSLDTHAIPMLELTNFDPGLSTPVCDAGSKQPTRLPPDGVAIFVLVGNDGRTAADLCGGKIDASSTGTAGSARYLSVMTFGPDVTEADRATAQQAWDSMSWDGRLTGYTRGRSPRYVLDGWREGSANVLLEALPASKNVDLSLIEVDRSGSSGDDVKNVDVPDPNAVEGDTFGAVTQDADRVEYHRAGVDTTLTARLMDLPPSLHAAFDAYAFEPRPEGGPFEVDAIGADGQVLGTNLPPLVHTEQVGTVRAFGTTWAVKVSTDAQGFSPSSCVEPAATSTSSPCDRPMGGGGPYVQSFDGQFPAVFVTEAVGGVQGIDLLADDGTVFHAVMVPAPLHGPGGDVAVVALVGGGRGRLVYHLSGGRTDEGRRPEAHVTWSDIGQVIGPGSFPPPSKA